MQRLMRIMGLRAIYRGPRTSRPAPEHRVYPYLLEKAKITRPNQVWAADITYLPMARGFFYMVAVMAWHSRYVGPGGCPTHWRRTSAWMPCKRRLGRAGPRCSTPTRAASSPAGTLQDHEVRISMDGKGRYSDNIFVSKFRINVRLSVQHKCHIHTMENVTLTAKKQGRLQVLNSLVAEHMTLDQAATLMGVSTPPYPAHPGGLPADGVAHLPTVIAAAELPTNRRRWPRRIDVRQMRCRRSGTERSQEPGCRIAQNH